MLDGAGFFGSCKARNAAEVPPAVEVSEESRLRLLSDKREPSSYVGKV